MAKKPVDLSGLVATKGTAAPVANMPARTPEPQEKPVADEAGGSLPLNFKVPADFRRRFKTYAAENDLKLNELLTLAFNEYAERHK